MAGSGARGSSQPLLRAGRSQGNAIGRDAIAQCCECRAWQEVTAAGALRSIFFGLPADFEAAHLLYGRVKSAFETEGRAFRAGPFYGGLRGGERRTAIASFQVGLANGICGKLRGLKAMRDEVRGSFG